MPNPAEEVVAFMRTNGVGCAFAMHIAKDPDSAGMRSMIIDTPVAHETLEAVFGALLDDAPLIATAIFPQVTTPEELVELLGKLAKLPDWRLEPIDIDDDTRVGVSLRWVMPDGEHESWVLGFAPFDFMPNTRRAPHVAIVMKADPTEQPFLQRKPEANGLRAIHLADLPFDGSVSAFARTWKATNRHKRRSLSGDKVRSARARVTFSVPIEYLKRIEGLAK